MPGKFVVHGTVVDRGIFTGTTATAPAVARFCRRKFVVLVKYHAPRKYPLKPAPCLCGTWYFSTPTGGAWMYHAPLLAALVAAYQRPDVPTPDTALAAPTTLWKRNSAYARRKHWQ